jgi:hypothetical protein
LGRKRARLEPWGSAYTSGKWDSGRPSNCLPPPSSQAPESPQTRFVPGFRVIPAPMCPALSSEECLVWELAVILSYGVFTGIYCVICLQK